MRFESDRPGGGTDAAMGAERDPDLTPPPTGRVEGPGYGETIENAQDVDDEEA